MAVFEVGEAGGEGVDGDAFDGAGLPFEGVAGEEGPAADEAPALDFGVGVLFTLDGGGGFFGGLFVVDDVDEFDVRVLGASSSLTPWVRVRRLGADSLPARMATLPLLFICSAR